MPSDDLRERVLSEIRAFVGDAPQHDDLTLVALKVDEVAATTVTINREATEVAEGA